jgi:hypothetical protein
LENGSKTGYASSLSFEFRSRDFALVDFQPNSLAAAPTVQSGSSLIPLTVIFFEIKRKLRATRWQRTGANLGPARRRNIPPHDEAVQMPMLGICPTDDFEPNSDDIRLITASISIICALCASYTWRPQLMGTDKDQLKRLHVKVPPTLLRVLDGWRREQPDLPSRSEAIRRLVSSGAAVRASSSEAAHD